ncbi:MAG: hypothetical protein R2731_10600 [Nocardioides sp.]
MPDCVVTSPADVAAPPSSGVPPEHGLALTGGPRDRRLLRPGEADGTAVVSVPWREERRATHVLAGWLPRWIRGSTGLMLGGLLGLASILVTDWARWPSRSCMRCGRSTSPRGSSRGGTADADGHEVPGWYLWPRCCSMLAAIVLTGTFIAGVVEWLQSTRTVGLIGRRTLPRRDHVVVAGLGQVGYRTCLLLRELGCRGGTGAQPGRAERPPRPGREDPGAARPRRGPGGAGEQVGLARAICLAALGSDDLDNVEIAINALAVAPGLGWSCGRGGRRDRGDPVAVPHRQRGGRLGDDGAPGRPGGGRAPGRAGVRPGRRVTS